MSDERADAAHRSSRRRGLLAELYGAEADEVGRRLDDLLDRHRRPERGRVLDERAAWVIAYPDHVRAPGRAPLGALAELVDDRLAPAITGVHTLPFHPASGDGGFSVIDPALVDPSFGTWADLARLSASSTWMVDLVLNHLSARSPWFRRFLAGDPAVAGFFRELPAGIDTSAVVRPRTTPLAHEFVGAAGPVRVWTTFSADQVDLDYRTPAVLLAMIEVLLRYVDHGAAAVRLDAVAFVGKDPATPSVHLPATHIIVALLRQVLDEVAPDVVLITETNVPHAENVSYFSSPGRPEADAVYQFALPPLVAHAVLTGDGRPLADWANTIAAPRAGTTFLNFLASHDGIGLRPAEGLLAAHQLAGLVAAGRAVGGEVNERSVGARSAPYELAVSWFALMAHGVDEATAVARHVAAHAIALALPGVPLLYLNSLYGIGNDTVMFTATGHARDLNRMRHDRVDLDARLADPSSREARVWSALRALLLRRAGDPAFHPDRPVAVSVDGDGRLVVDRDGRRVSVGLRAPYEVRWPGGDEGAAQ